MDQITLTVFFYLAVLVVVLLTACVLYLVFVYRKLLDKYTDLTLHSEKSELKKQIKIDTSEFVNKKIDTAVTHAVDEAVGLISKKADKVADVMRSQTLEKLKINEESVAKSVAAQYSEADDRIKAYEAQKIEEVKKNANEILKQVITQALGKSLDIEKQEELVLKALENAKKSNLF